MNKKDKLLDEMGDCVGLIQIIASNLRNNLIDKDDATLEIESQTEKLHLIQKQIGETNE